MKMVSKLKNLSKSNRKNVWSQCHERIKMIKKLKIEVAVHTILIIAALVLVFHLLVISCVIPYQYVWGGRLESTEQMLWFESISMIINLFIILIVSMKGNYIRSYLSNRVVKVFLWIFSILFILNTVGNLFSLTSLESIIATPITFVLAIMFLRLAIE